MRHIIAAVSAAALMMLTACNNSTETRNAYGTITAVDKNSITLSTGAETLTFAHTHSPECKHGWLIEGDSVSLLYTETEEGLCIEEVAVISHLQPDLNNAAAMLVGTWNGAKADSSYSITINANNTAHITDGTAKRESQWILSGREVVMHIDKDERHYSLIRVDSDSLMVRVDDEILKLGRKY